MTERQRRKLEILADPESPRHSLHPDDCEAVRAALNEIDLLKVVCDRLEAVYDAALQRADFGVTGIP